MPADHPRCAIGSRCVISVAGGGAHLSALCPKPYCIPCDRKKRPPEPRPKAK
jgi:hypothetical protein